MFNDEESVGITDSLSDGINSIIPGAILSGRNEFVITYMETVCPDCGIKLVRLGCCFSCPRCGFGSCG